ncbi:MAG: shikimate dehydrogenase [Simkaniaceae bacterium]|nr:shikimate dehydrogenase [Simkaniaceae bacterium]
MSYKRGMLVITVQGNFKEAKKIIQTASKLGDAVEFRLDLMEEVDFLHLSKLKACSKLPIIFTLRKQSQGGRFLGSEAEREAKLLELLTLKPDYVDLEYDANFFDKIDPEVQVISSYHNLEKTPDNLEKILQKMMDTPAAIYKLATMAHSSLDALRMLLFVKKRKSVAGMCTGAFGEITRILAPVVGSPLAYTFLDKETMPGQISIYELINTYHYPTLNQSTEIYGLIGDPVTESIGHFCYNQIFKKAKKNGVYVKISLKPFEVSEFFRLTKKLPFVGLSVTMPLKETVAPHLAEMDPQTKKVGAINTLVRRKGEWFGTNTDGKGALDALEKKGKVCQKTLVIIGAGGAAKAISTEASKRGARVIITNRTFEKAQALAHQIQGVAIPMHEIDQCPYDIIVNTTAVGMVPKTGETPIAPEFVRKNAVGFDVVMRLKKTSFLNTIQNKGGDIVCGYEMYAQQVLGQLKAWSIQRISDEEALSLIEHFTP